MFESYAEKLVGRTVRAVRKVPRYPDAAVPFCLVVDLDDGSRLVVDADDVTIQAADRSSFVFDGLLTPASP